MKRIDLRRDEKNAQYYEGTFIKRWSTSLGHLIIQTKETKVVKYINGVPTKLNVNSPEMNFLVPSRRHGVTETCRQLREGETIIIKLLKESRSGKFAVCEVGQ